VPDYCRPDGSCAATQCTTSIDCAGYGSNTLCSSGTCAACPNNCPLDSVCTLTGCICVNTGLPTVAPSTGTLGTTYTNNVATAAYDFGPIPAGDDRVRGRAAGTPATRRLQRSCTDADALAPLSPLPTVHARLRQPQHP
jgi:hypothetical protein